MPSTISAGTTAGTAIAIAGDTTGNLAFQTNGTTTAMTIDTSQNVGIGTTSPSGKFDVYTASNTDAYVRGDNAVRLFLTASSYNWQIASNYYRTGGLQFVQGGTTQGHFDDSGNFQFNSGYGSAATAYGCRAWVNFDGTGTPAIRASGNVSSITDRGVGTYDINYTNALSANMAPIGFCSDDSASNRAINLQGTNNGGTNTTTFCRVTIWAPGSGSVDSTGVYIAVFR